MGTALSMAQQLLFQESWHAFPLIDEIGLFGLLNGILVMSVFWQMWWFHSGYRDVVKELHRWPGSQVPQGSRPRSGLLNDLHGIVDIAGILPSQTCCGSAKTLKQRFHQTEDVVLSP